MKWPPCCALEGSRVLLGVRPVEDGVEERNFCSSTTLVATPSSFMASR